MGEMAELASLTEQLQHFSSGERQVAEAMLREILPKLHQIAVRELRRERSIAQLSPTELINEVWLRNLGRGGWQVNSRNHFYAIASLAMRRVLIDLGRARMAQRRGCGEGVSPPVEGTSLQAVAASPESMVQIGMLMDALEKVDKEWARVVDMHYFAGFTLEEIAEITGLSLRQIRQRWEKGRDWLKDHLR
jgi:RNA polymerase sigma factor (TIGR02999 family)